MSVGGPRAKPQTPLVGAAAQMADGAVERPSHLRAWSNLIGIVTRTDLTARWRGKGLDK